MENKHNKAVTIFLVVVIVLLIAGLGVMTYFLINLNNKVLDLSNDTNNQNAVEQETSKVDTNTNSSNQIGIPIVENNVQNTQSGETKKEETTSNSRVFIEPSLNMNGNDKNSKYTKHVKGTGARAYLTAINQVLLRYDTNGECWKSDSIDRSLLSKDYYIEFGDKKVVDIFIAGPHMFAYGDDEILFFLMEDGTVEFLPLIYAIRNNKFESCGKIEGVEDVVKIGEYGVGQGLGVVTSMCAITNNGKFYQLNGRIDLQYYYMTGINLN